ncbi:TlpA family protein disulfide reductase, partial [Candidatus Protofrankia californiensis]|uniref:TlpA family protein disulfide reductase n=1 Tax=Candidatus Protofrankia californiensis TaxID=1839754 RepID=UPI0013ED63CA
LRGTVVVVNVWASWCAPCRAETPGLVEVYAQTHTQGVAFLGINIRDSLGAAQAFVRDYHVPYPSLYDPSASLLVRLRVLPPTTIPSTLVLDRRGRVAARFLNAVAPDDLRPVLSQLLAESTTG